MFAYVRFIDDDVCTIVPIEKIKKFDINDSRKYELKYYVQYEDGEYYKANIIYIKENIEELKSTIKAKRIKLINKNLLVSQSSDDDTVVESVSKVDESQKRKESSSKKRKCIQEMAKENIQNSIVASYNTNSHNCEKIKPNASSEKEQIRKLESEIKYLKNEIENQKDLYKKRDAQLKKAQHQITELSSLNISLQKNVINMHEELSSNLKKIITRDAKTINPDGRETDGRIGVGSVVNGKVHLRRNVFIDETVYDSCFILSSKSGARFVKNIAVAVFGIQTLRESTVTGRISNRCKNTMQEARRPLDPTKLQAIHDIYEHYMKKKGTNDVVLGLELNKVCYYISSKISDLIKAVGKENTPRTKKTLPRKKKKLFQFLW